VTPRPDSPGVRFPPPFLYAAAVLGGILLDRRWALPIGGGAWRESLALVLAAAWVLLTAPSVATFWRARTSMIPARPATTLVVAGPYRFTRNPMYLGLALLSVAFALFFNSYWVILLLVPALVLVTRLVIVREERYLRRRFGADYEAYTKRVRRWL
jgi:protein-S-isoprenylcysteine O-methyltransferase Ste14